jgi:hypothetical protein
MRWFNIVFPLFEGRGLNEIFLKKGCIRWSWKHNKILMSKWTTCNKKCMWHKWFDTYWFPQESNHVSSFYFIFSYLLSLILIYLPTSFMYASLIILLSYLLMCVVSVEGCNVTIHKLFQNNMNSELYVYSISIVSTFWCVILHMIMCINLAPTLAQ